VERKLAAILSADVKGYSRLMGEDEEATIRTLTAYRAVMSTRIQQQRGRVVDSPGDNLLAEFASVVDAVRCAVAIQRELQTRNAALPAQRRMEFRIGLNLGDVVVEGERLYGDGVNIAARIEGLAEPGGLCISGTVYDQIETKLPLTYDYLGEQTVKNIAKPVRVWRVLIDDAAAAVAEQTGLRPHDSPQEGHAPQRLVRAASRTWVVVVIAGVVLLVGGSVTVRYFIRPPLNTQSSVLSSQAAPAALPLPDKPSIVVLPFVNMSEDPKQDYFSDGMTEDLTTALSQLSSLFVIARNSAFTYKGKAVKVQDVGKELGVQYVLEGSVRRANDQVRITAQLVDAPTGSHIWAERYDRPLRDIFALQDEIVQKIVTTLKLQLTVREQGYLVRKHTENLEAYDYLLRGMESYNRSTKEANAQARQLLEKAIELDPQYAEAYARLSWIRTREWNYLWVQDPQTLEQALALAQKAVALDDALPGAYAALGYVSLYRRQHEQAMVAARRAIALGPNEAEGPALLGLILNFAGRPEDAIGLIQQAIRLNPRYPYNYLTMLGMAYGLARRYEEAITVLQSALSRNPNAQAAHLHLTMSYSELGRDAEVRTEVAELLRLSPTFSLEGVRRVMPFKDPVALERYLAALRKGGLK
jgi:adenylate cyclase